MYEGQPYEKDETNTTEDDRILAWSKDVADSTAKEARDPRAQSPHSKPRRLEQEPARAVEQEPPRVVVNQIVQTPAVVVTRVRSEPIPKEEISTKAVIGTVLGATAGAVVAYAMTRSQTEANHAEHPKRVAYKIIDSPATYESVEPDHGRKPSHQVIAAPSLMRPYVDGMIPQSDHSHHSCLPLPRSHAEGATFPPTHTKISVVDPGNSRPLHASSRGKTARQSDSIPITEVRSAKEIPLPYSHVTSSTTEKREESKTGKCSVSPKESISQVSTRRSGDHARSKDYSGHNFGSSKGHHHESRRSRTSKQ